MHVVQRETKTFQKFILTKKNGNTVYSEWSLFLDYLIGIFSKFGTLKRHKYTWGLGEAFYHTIKKYMWKVK